MYDSDHLRGIGGWLAFLVIWTLVLAPIGFLTNAAALFFGGNTGTFDPNTFRAVQIVSGGIAIVQAFAFGIVGWRLNYRHVMSSVKVAIIVLWAAGLGLNLVNLAAFWLLTGVNLFPITAVNLLITAAWSLAWTLYLKLSVRVQNTYAEAELEPVFN